MESFPFPIVRSCKLPLVNGFFIKVPGAFQGHRPDKFQDYLRDLPQEEKLFEDAIGFSVMPFNWCGEWIHICAVRIEGYFDHDTKRIIGKDFNPVMPQASFLDMLSKYRLTRTTQSKESPDSGELEDFFTATMHELRPLNAQIKVQIEEILNYLDTDKLDEFIHYRAQNIFGTSSLISTRLDAYDFHLNPNAFTKEMLKPLHVYKKFEKAIHCLRIAARKQSVRLDLAGASYATFPGHDIFEILPFVLIENATKYSPKNHDVVVRFSENLQHLTVMVESVGPLLLPDEHNKVFEKRFRGIYAKKAKSGTGTGLHFAKLVSDLHKIEIKVKSHQDKILEVSGVPYSKFEVEMRIIL